MNDHQTPMNFRFLPAYRKRRHVKVALCETVFDSSDHVDSALHDGGQLLPPEVETVSPRNTPSTASSSSATSLAKSPTPRVWKPNRKRKCIELCKRVAAFLLSTIGLTMLTVLYAVAGGYLFSALESENEVAVKSGVAEALRWHIDVLWSSTAQLNVLHPVGYVTLFTARLI